MSGAHRPPSRAPRPRIVVAGCGVAGSLVAHGLRGRDDVELVALERVRAADHSDSGTGLNIGPNALKSLDSLDAALAADLRAVSLPWRGWRIELADGTPLMDLPLARVADRDGIRIRWSTLYELLRGRVADRLRFGCEARAVRTQPDGRLAVDIDTPDGPQRLDDVDLLLAADGRYSRLREAVLGRPAVRQLGVAIARLLVPDASGGLVDDYVQIFNGSARLLGFRVLPAHLYLTAALPLAADADIPPQMRTGRYLRDAFEPAAGAPSPAAAFMVDALARNESALHWARMQEGDAAYRACGGRVVFLGDAAHPMVPTLGQGATQAIEDAVCAVDVLREALDAGAAAGTAHAPAGAGLAAAGRGLDAPAVAGAFEARRAERVRFVAALSWAASDTMLAGADPVAGAREKASAAFLARLERLYGDAALARPGHDAALARPGLL